MSDDDRIGWEIDGKFYPHHGFEALTHGHYALIADVTGLTTDEFLLEEDTLRTESGWIAVAFWQGNPGMKRHHVAAYMQQLPIEGATRVGFVEVEDDAVPPKESSTTGSKSPTSGEPPADESPPTPPSRSATASTEEPPLEQSTRNGSGGQGSATGATSGPETSDRLKTGTG